MQIKCQSAKALYLIEVFKLRTVEFSFLCRHHISCSHCLWCFITYYVSVVCTFYSEQGCPPLLDSCLSQNCPCVTAAFFVRPGTRCGLWCGVSLSLWALQQLLRASVEHLYSQILDFYSFLHYDSHLLNILSPLVVKLGFYFISFI